MVANLIPLYLYQGQPLPPPARIYDYVLAAQGLLKRLDTPYVTAEKLLVPVVDTSLPGLQLKPYPLTELRLKIPRIPGRLLAEVYQDACRHLDVEVAYHFRYTPERGWWIDQPQLDHQSAVRIRYRYQPDHLICELHSHHTMPAFFSTTDDSDEQGAHFYAVIGRLNTDQPELALRLGLCGHWLSNLPGLTLFTDTGPCLDVWLDAPPPVPTKIRWYEKLFSGR